MGLIPGQGIKIPHGAVLKKHTHTPKKTNKHPNISCGGEFLLLLNAQVPVNQQHSRYTVNTED